jgi:hypothetical protein
LAELFLDLGQGRHAPTLRQGADTVSAACSLTH